MSLSQRVCSPALPAASQEPDGDTRSRSCMALCLSCTCPDFPFWFSTPGATLLDKTAFPFSGGESGFHFLSHFYGVHHNLSVEITRGKLPTLYKPKSPRSRSTLRALTLGPVVISPATCSRIFTISSGLVKMTWEPPACRQGRREKQISKSEPDWQCNKKKSRKASKSYHFTSPSSPGNKRMALWPVHRDGPKLLKPIYGLFVL